MPPKKQKQLRSALYVGSTTHARRLPSNNRFNYKVYMAYIDLHEASSGMLDCWPLFSTRTPFALLSLLPRDHMIAQPPHQHETLLAPVSQLVQNATGTSPEGSICLLTNLRVFGIEFNPVSFYYVFNPLNEDGSSPLSNSQQNNELMCVIAEVGNFPWFEQHNYVVLPEEDENTENNNTVKLDSSPLRRFSTHDKQFHVSPFMQIDGIKYDWKISTPAQHLQVRIGLTQNEERSFFASLDAKRIEWNTWNLLKLQVLHPVQALKVMLAILYEAQKLFRAGFTFFPHPHGTESTLSRSVASVVTCVQSIKQLFRLPRREHKYTSSGMRS